MSGKNLTFKLVMDADNKGLVSTAKNSESVMKSVFDSIKSESDKLKQASAEASSEVGNLVPSDTKQKVAQLVVELTSASKALETMGSDADLSADNLKQMGDYGQKALSGLQEDLKQAKLHLNYLSATNATPEDLGNAVREVKELEIGVRQVKTAFDAYKSSADGASTSTAEASKEFGNIVPKGTSELADKLTQSLSAATGIIKDAGDNAKSTASNFTDFGNKAEKALSQLKSDLSQAKQKLQEFSATNASPADIEKAKVQVDQLEKEVQQADQAFNGFHAEVGKANTNLKNTDSAAQTAQKGLNGAKFAVTALVGAMGAFGIGLGVRELAEAADSYTNLSTRINIATKDGGDFTSAMAGVHQVALATNSSLEATGSLFTRLNAVGKDMGMTQQEALDLTKTVTQAIQVGGGSAQASEAAVQQFIQAMQGGVLRGEEFNSIMENGYGVAEALAKGLGVTTGELRKMAENGELGAERVVKALQSQAGQIQETYNQFPTTISNALQKIATSWQILIGDMDQANGASATAAQWLSTLADNMSLLKPIIDDIGDGFTRFGEYYSNIYDQGTIDSLKTTLISVYDTIKTLFNTVLEVGEAFHDVFSDALSSALGFTDGLYPAGEEVSGFQKFIDLLNIALGFLSDGFKTIGIGVNLFTGTLYGLLAVWYELKSKLSWGDAKKEAIANMEAMRAKSEEYFTKGFDGAKNFESKTIETIQNIGKTDKEKNQERIADSQKTLDELKAQEEKHKADYKAISDERIKLEQQLYDARKSGNQAAIDLAVRGLSDLGAKEKAYQAESKKISDEKIQAAQDWVNTQLVAADGTQKAADAATQKTMQTTLAAQGLKLEFDSAGKAIVKAMDDGAKATENQGSATDKARKAATTLKLDLYELKNGITETFNTNSKVLSDFANGVEQLGFKGEKAGNAIYQAWLKWLETAKSQNEVDVAMFKLQEFGKKGQMSTKQVEMGMLALRQVIQKLPADLDPVEQAFERLGIKTKENLKLAAQSALADFNTVQASGKATAEGMRQAYERVMQAAAASGDVAVQSSVSAKAASLGLQVQIDETGKASVKSMDELTSANDRVRNSAERIGDGYRHAGKVAREEAKSSTEAWADAVNAASKNFDAEMKRQSKSLSKGIYDYSSYSKADVLSQLKSKGYNDKEAEKLAGSIWSEAMAADRSAKEQGLGKDGSLAVKALINAEFNNAASKGLTTQHGTNKINDFLSQMTASSLVSTGPSAKPVDINSLAPNVSTPVPTPANNVDSGPKTTIRFELNGQQVDAQVNTDQVDPLVAMLEKLKTMKNSS